jgi:fumarate reductase subunit C
MSIRLYLLQRLSAAILAVLVLVHLAVIRTRGSLGWGLFYGLFVATVAVHGSIGLREIMLEWMRLGRGAANGAAWAVALILLALGLRAVWAVTGGGVA